MTDSFYGAYDPNAPPHMADATGVQIREVDDPDRWDPGQRAFADWVRGVWVSGLVPPSAPIEALGHYVGSVHKLAIVDGGADFVYRIYGERIKHAANLDLQSKSVGGLIEPARSAFLAHYRDLMERPRLFVGSVRYGGLIRSNPYWLRAAAPLGGAAHDGFVVLTYPVTPSETED